MTKHITITLTREQLWQCHFNASTTVWRTERDIKERAAKGLKPNRTLTTELAFEKRLMEKLAKTLWPSKD